MLGEYLVRILLAVLVGALIGAEREYRDKAAGFRTIMLITVASALFAILSQSLTEETGDPSRIASGVVSGVGFLGAGVIMRVRGDVRGITTAATIWASAALGLGMGAGRFALTLATAAAILTVLWLLPRFEYFIDRQKESVTYRIECAAGHGKIQELELRYREHGLRVYSYKEGKEQGRLVVNFTAIGSRDSHQAMMGALFADDEIVAFET